MRGLFSRLGGASPKAQSAQASAQQDVELPQLLAKTGELLKKLRESSSEDFPLLNDATRHVQLLEGSVAALPDGEGKSVWRSQLVELQKDLKSSTERMLSGSNNTKDTLKASEQSSSKLPGASLFEGMSLMSDPAEPTPHGLPSKNLGEAATQSIRERGSSKAGSDALEHAFMPPVLSPQGNDKASNAASAPLPEDLFSGLDDLTMTLGGASPAEADTAKAPETDVASARLIEDVSQLTPGRLHRQGSDVSSVSTAASVPHVAAGPPGSARKKRITRRVGYARDADDEEPPPRAKQSAPSPDLSAQGAAPGSRPAPAARPAAADQPEVHGSLDPLGEEQHASPAPSARPEAAAFSQALGAQSDDSLVALGGGDQEKSLSLSGWNRDSRSMQGTDLPGSSAHPEAHPAQENQYNAVDEQGNTPAAIQSQVQRKLADLQRQVVQAASKSSEAKQKRRSLLADISSCTRELEEAKSAEGAAVEAEDFEKAAALGATADAAKARLAHLQQAVRAVDSTCEGLVKDQLALTREQAEAYESASEALRRLQGRHEQSASNGAQSLKQAEASAREAEASSREHLEDLLARMEARERWLAGERESLEAKIREATAPSTAGRDKHLQAAEVLRAEVETLRAALATKEAELANAEAELAESQAQVKTLSAKYDRVKQHLEHDEQALAAQHAEYEEAQAAAKEAAASSQAAVARESARQKSLQEQASEAEAAARSMQKSAASIRKQVEAESAMLDTHASLAKELQAAEAAVKEAEESLEEARGAIRNLSGQRAKLSAGAQAAEERGSAARARLPDLEAGKKTAASARDFKEAARLAAEAKAKTAEADSELAKAEALREQASGMASEEAAAAEQLGSLEGRLASVQRDHALASWRLLKAVYLDLQSNVAAAVAADRFSEADALQGELDAATADAAALESAHAFTDRDLGSSLQSLSSLSTAQDNAAAAQAKASGPSPVTDSQDTSTAQPVSVPQLPAAAINEPAEEPAENGATASSGGDLGPHTRLQDVAASEAARPASAQTQQRPDSGGRQQLAAIGLSRQLTDERTLSGYITDSDSAAEATPTLRGDPAGHGAQLPFAGQLQSAKSREALSAVGLGRQRTTRRMPSGYLADSDSQDLGNLKAGPSVDSMAAKVATSRPFSDEASSLPDMSTVVIPENIAEHDGPESGRRDPNVAVPSLALDKVPSLQGKASGNTAAMSQMSKPDSESEAAPPLAEIRPRPDTLTSEQVAALDGLDSSRLAASESSTPAHAHGQDQVFSLAETARLFHRDNKGSTAATFGGSTYFGGSDAGTGVSYSEALGSAWGAHSLGPSESDSEVGDAHPHAMEEAGREPHLSCKGPQKLHAGHMAADTFHEAASSRDNASVRSDEAFFQTHSSGSPQSTPSVLSPARDEKPGAVGQQQLHEEAMSGPDFPEDSSVHSKEPAEDAGADMFAGLTLG